MALYGTCKLCGGETKDYICPPCTHSQLTKLLEVIKEVHSQHADDLCWMDIDKIFVATGLPVPDRKIGNRIDMHANCWRYLTVLCKEGGEWKSYAELEKENADLRKQMELPSFRPYNCR